MSKRGPKTIASLR